jgi:acetyltransferase
MRAGTHRDTWPRTVRLDDGLEYRVRPICHGDTARERDFILALSPHSRFDRLMYTLKEPSAEFLSRLVDVDMERDAALVAVIGDDEAEKFIGVARYAADATGHDCEFAVAIADDWQCRGIGSTLTRMLFDYAKARGFRSIYGTILASNQRMLELAEWLGLTIEPPVPGQTTVRAARRLN